MLVIIIAPRAKQVFMLASPRGLHLANYCWNAGFLELHLIPVAVPEYMGISAEMPSHDIKGIKGN